MRLVIAPLLALLLTVLFGASMRAGGDIMPPVLVDATADRVQIDTSQAAQTVTFTLYITDDLAGFSHAQMAFRHEHDYNTSRECQHSTTPAVRDATVTCAVTWPQYSAEGRWMVTWFVLTDGVGNADDGNVATCEQYIDGRCIQYVYNDKATPAIRAMEITIGDPLTTTDPPLYLPSIMAN